MNDELAMAEKLSIMRTALPKGLSAGYESIGEKAKQSFGGVDFPPSRTELSATGAGGVQAPLSIPELPQPNSGGNFDQFFVQFDTSSFGNPPYPVSAYVVCHRGGLFKVALPATVTSATTVEINDTDPDWPPVGDLPASIAAIGGGAAILTATDGEILNVATAIEYIY